jgi:glycogen debranching enzyme
MGYKSKDEARSETMKYLIPHRINLENDKWLGLPELTNSHGKVCHDSCTTQAWSVGTILDAMRDLYYFKAKR